MSSEDFRHAPGWVKDGEAAGPDGVVRETGHVAGVKAQTGSAANAATGDTATLRGDHAKTIRETLEYSKRMRGSAADDAALAALSALQEERERMRADSRRLASHAFIPRKTGECECPTRKALEEMLRLTELLSPPDTHVGACGPESGCDGACAELAAIAGAVSRGRAALNSPCPGDGLRQERDAAYESLGRSDIYERELEAERDSLRAELAGARDALIGEGFPITSAAGQIAAGIRSTGAGWKMAEMRERERIEQALSLRAELQKVRQDALHDVLSEQGINAELRAELAASQERERVLREALAYIAQASTASPSTLMEFAAYAIAATSEGTREQ